MQIIQWLDAQLNRITMYRVLLYGLSLILVSGFIVSFLKLTSFTPIQLAASIVILLVACFATNRVLARGFDIPSNYESSLITALILACIIQPPTTMSRVYGTLLIGVVAMASKYLLALHRQHIFNPAALAAVIVGSAGLLPITWWIATPELFPIVAIIGLLILRKTRHFKLFGIFFIASLITIGGFALLQGMPLLVTLRTSVVSWPLIFFGTIMLTEPITMPAEKSYQSLFALLVGVVCAAQLKFGGLHTTPELALVVGNMFAFIVNPRGRFILKLQSKYEMAPHIYDFVFVPVNKKETPHFRYLPGQYIDWTLPHKPVDSRGNRRTFTIASSPSEPTLRLGIKFVDASSSFKQALLGMKVGDEIYTNKLAGNFIMPRNPSQKLVFIGGGIGITPFRSMIKSLVDSKQKRDITLFHLINTKEEAVYHDLFARAQSVGVKTRYIVKEGHLPTRARGLVGEFSPEYLTKESGDVAKNMYYISGPPAMVDHYVALLKSLGCKRGQIVTDFFSGY